MTWLLPQHVKAAAGTHPLGVYVHVPWCARRCTYCDFNTYVRRPVPGPADGPAGTAAVLAAELELLRAALPTLPGPVQTVFFGGGTPTLLPPNDLGRVLAAIRDLFGIGPDAEVTTEANPESVDPGTLHELRGVGFNRLSLGMQSAVPAVLETLGRAHPAGAAERAVGWAAEAGFAQVSLDLIYGTPGESGDDWRRTLSAAVDTGVDHVSAYSLKIEPGTALGAALRRRDVAETDPDVLADRYEIADSALEAAGLRWYEISNWARPGAECRHNLGYWRGHDWIGIGPGAHSHVAGSRWWNERNPGRAAGMVAGGRLPIETGESLSAEERELERLMLGIRLREGVAIGGRQAYDAATAVADGLLDEGMANCGRARLTRRGRLLADAVTRTLTA